MLKSNSKEVKKAVRKYIMDAFNPCDYAELSGVDRENFSEVSTAILATFYEEKKHDYSFKSGRCSLFDLFRDWCSGLAQIIGGCWYYNENPVDLVGDWMQETEEEKNRFSVSDAERMIDYLIFRELTAAADANWKGGAFYA